MLLRQFRAEAVSKVSVVCASEFVNRQQSPSSNAYRPTPNLVPPLRPQALSTRSLNTQSLSAVKRLYLNESRSSLLELVAIGGRPSVRNSRSYLPKRKRGWVWQGRKEELDYDRSGLLPAFYFNCFLVFVVTIYYWKKGMFTT